VHHVALDAADAVELIEILQYFIETLDRIAEDDAVARVTGGLDTYGISDLRADIERLINRLQLSPLTP
jgi:hypothetical protein